MHTITINNNELDIVIAALRKYRGARVACIKLNERGASRSRARHDIDIIDGLLGELLMAKAEG